MGKIGQLKLFGVLLLVNGEGWIAEVEEGELVVAGEQVGGEKRWVNVGLTGGDYLNGWE